MNMQVESGYCFYKPRNAKIASKLPEARNKIWNRFFLIGPRRNKPC